MSTTKTTSDTSSKRTTDEQVILTTNPSIKPTAVMLVLTVIVGFAVIVYLRQNPGVLGEATVALGRGVEILLVIAVLGLVSRIYVLMRTSYIVTTSTIRRRFEFFYREKNRTLPLTQVRATELDRGRIQSLLGFGTLRFLSGGTNQSLGFVDFESIPNPDDAHTRIQPYLERGRGQEPANKDRSNSS